MRVLNGDQPRCHVAILLGCGWIIAATFGLPADRCPADDSAPRKSPVTRTDPAAASRPKPQFSSERFVRSLRANRDDVRFRALAEAERFHNAHAALPDALWQAIQFDLHGKRISDSTLAAVRLHGRLDGAQVVEQQTSLLSAADMRVVMLAMENLGTRRAEGALASLTGLTERPDYRANYGFRQALVSSVGHFAEPASVDFLVATMNRSSGQLKYEASRRLALVTGKDFGGNAAAWRTWWTENRDGFRFPEPQSAQSATSGVIPALVAAAPRNRTDDDVPTFYGAPIYAQRVVFVIDRSRSMLSTVDEVTRLSEAQRELETALEKLPDDAEFNVLAYETVVTRWQPRLMPATLLDKANALRFANGLDAVNKTDCYTALADALEHDNNIEAVLFLSDGEPTAGQIVDRQRIVQEITRKNAFRRTSINAIGIDADGVSGEFLRQLSELNFGVYRAVR